MVDAGRAEFSDEALAAIRQLSGWPIQYIIDTSGDPDHVAGNLALASAGFANSGQRGEPTRAGIVAQLNVLSRMNQAKAPPGSTPTDTYRGTMGALQDEAVLLTHGPTPIRTATATCFFRSSDVISTGELFNPSAYPVIEQDRAAASRESSVALNDIIGVMVPRQNEEGGTYLVPAHGPICDHTAIVNYRDALAIIQRADPLLRRERHDARARCLASGRASITTVSTAPIPAPGPPGCSSRRYTARFQRCEGPWRAGRLAEES